MTDLSPRAREILTALKAADRWKFTMHGDGKGFSINFHEAEWNGKKLRGWRRTGKGDGVGYECDGATFSTLADLAMHLAAPIEAGDEPEARDD